MDKTQIDTDANLGNTNQIRARGWAITQNNWSETQYKQYLDEANKTKYYIIGKEIAPTTGTHHLQIYFYYENDRTFQEIKRKFPEAHISKANGTPKQNMKYCSKENDYITNFKLPKPLKVLNESQLYDWQKKIETIVVSEPNDRHIHWFWEPIGNYGKTALCKYLKNKYNEDICVISAPKSADILTCAEETYTTYIFDFSRTQEGYEPYNALEQLKNGMITDAKLKKKARLLLFNPPNIICMANFPPNEDKLSKDRWIINNLREVKLPDLGLPQEAIVPNIPDDIIEEMNNVKLG